PRFSTRAESRMYRLIVADIIGMTVVPECQLARELEMCYSSIATVTDYDVWKEVDVDVELIMKTLKENEEKVRKIVKEVLPLVPLGDKRKCACPTTLRGADV
ncbi:MAG: S-methyl-5'-thioadenosine phosphorylase, partial [Thermoplasmata archaeon]